MEEPPPYEWNPDDAKQSTVRGDQNGKIDRLCIRDELLVTRSQHVAHVVDALVDRVRSRAKAGVGRTELMLLPSDQDLSKTGTLVTFGDIRPDLIQLESSKDTREFWSQTEVLIMLKQRMRVAIASELGIPPLEEEHPLPPPPQASAAPKSRWFLGGRKQSEEVKPTLKLMPAPSPVSVTVQLEEVSFRRESEYGLLETIREFGIMLSVDIH